MKYKLGIILLLNLNVGFLANKNVEKVKKIKNISDIQNVKNIKKIKNIKQIDGDLAEEMKDEIERGAESDYEVTVNQKKDKSHKIKVGTVSAHDDLKEKVDRILNMFNVSNLDDIVEVDTLPQQNKIEEGFEYSFPILELKNRQRNEYKYSIEQENKEIISLESLIEEIHLKITKKQEELSEQRKILIYITQLLLEAMNNVRSIQMLLREHNMKANLMQDDVHDLYDKLKKLQLEKIRHLQLLSATAELKKDETASLINRAANQEVEEMMENSRTKDQKKYYEIDKSKYDTYPLQKIIGIQKIKSFAELSDQQAAKLKQLQEERNSA